MNQLYMGNGPFCCLNPLFFLMLNGQELKEITLAPTSYQNSDHDNFNSETKRRLDIKWK